MKTFRFVACAMLLAGIFFSLELAREPPVRAQDPGPGGSDRLAACFDVDRNGRIDLTDPLILLDWLFKGGAEPGDCLASAGEAAGDLARQMAGVYLVTVRVGDQRTLQLLGFHDDGTYAATGTNDFGGGDLERNGFESPEHGTWELRDEGKIAATSLVFAYDSNGALIRSLRVRSTLSFAKLERGKLQDVAGDFSIDSFNPGQSPVMDEPEARNAIQGTLAGKRLSVVSRALTSCYDVDRNGRIDLTDPVLLLQWLFQGATEPAPCPAGEGGGRDQLGEAIAGVFFRPVVGAPPEFQDLITLYEDGTFTATTTLDFGHGDLERNGFRSPEHGVWEMLGPGEIGTTSLILKYTSRGALEEIHRNRSTIRFSDLRDDKFQETAGELSVDIFGPGQDPLIDRSPPTDGTWQGVGSDDYGFGDLGRSGFQSPELGGVWAPLDLHGLSTRITLGFQE